VLGLEVEDRIYPWLTTLTSELLLYFTKVNWIHDNDVIRAVFAQKCRRYDPLSGTRKEFADAVRVDVNDMFDLVSHSECC
jgi:hypothetical protein